MDMRRSRREEGRVEKRRYRRTKTTKSVCHECLCQYIIIKWIHVQSLKHRENESTKTVQVMNFMSQQDNGEQKAGD